MPILKVMQWSKPNQLLIIANHDNINNVFKLELDADKNSIVDITSMSAPNAKWANLTKNNALIYTDNNKKVWLKNFNSDIKSTEEIMVLSKQLSGNKLTLANNYLYGINSKKQLWQYRLLSKQFQILNQLPSSVKYVSDVNKNKALITETLLHNKEIIEFY